MEGDGRKQKQIIEAKMAFVEELIATMKEQNKLIQELVETIRTLINAVAIPKRDQAH